MIDNANKSEPKPDYEGPVYDKTNIANEQLKSHCLAILEICQREGIPLLCTFVVRNDAESSGYVTTATSGVDGFFPSPMVAALEIIKDPSPGRALTAYHMAKKMVDLADVLAPTSEEKGEKSE